MTSFILETPTKYRTPTREIWDREYSELRVIPSSTRTEPARALVLLEPYWNSSRPLTVLDAGAGIGRNSAYLASLNHKVVAQDFSKAALKSMRQVFAKKGFDNKISIVDSSLHGTFPYQNDTYDLILDSYVSCHFMEEDQREHYWAEIWRVLRPGGLVFSAQFSIEDEYYAELASSGLIAGSMVIDPRNEIPKFLETRESLVEQFNEKFNLQQLSDVRFDDTVVGKSYRRSILAALLQK